MNYISKLPKNVRSPTWLPFQTEQTWQGSVTKAEALSGLLTATSLGRHTVCSFCLRLPSSAADDTLNLVRVGRAWSVGGVVVAYRLHGVVHGHEGLQTLPLQHVGELHVDGLHGPRVAHDPVLVGVGRVVVARRAVGKHVPKSGMVWAHLQAPGPQLPRSLSPQVPSLPAPQPPRSPSPQPPRSPGSQPPRSLGPQAPSLPGSQVPRFPGS